MSIPGGTRRLSYSLSRWWETRPGGLLCISTLLALRDAGEPCPGAALLISPWVDPLAATGSILTNEPFDVGDREFLVRCIETYNER